VPDMVFGDVAMPTFAAGPGSEFATETECVFVECWRDMLNWFREIYDAGVGVGEGYENPVFEVSDTSEESEDEGTPEAREDAGVAGGDGQQQSLPDGATERLDVGVGEQMDEPATPEDGCAVTSEAEVTLQIKAEDAETPEATEYWKDRPAADVVGSPNKQDRVERRAIGCGKDEEVDEDECEHESQDKGDDSKNKAEGGESRKDLGKGKGKENEPPAETEEEERKRRWK